MLTYNLLNDALELGDFVDNFFRGKSNWTRRGDFPYINVYEGNDEIEIRAIVPGLEAEEIDIQLENDSITISGQKKNNQTEDNYIKKERLFGEFKKSVKLPYRVDTENIKAELKNGILLVKLTKSEDAKPRKIEIH